MDRFHRAVVVDPVPAALRWLLVVPTTIVTWIATMFAMAIASALVHGMLPLDAIDRIAGIEIREGIVGALAAFAWVVSGSVMAPSRRRWASLALFALGAWAAYHLLWDWRFPENHPLGYQISRVPFYLTMIGGIAGVATIWLGGDPVPDPGQAVP
ncbi:MAG: hypothetical protein JO306_11705 [Gemmatimonadetes bacterium]|nr:hypothetical protein [Gemmatimonadota bacterium]